MSYNLLRQRLRPNFKTQIPTNLLQHKASERWIHMLQENWRLLRREFSLLWHGQKKLECTVIPADVRRILWISTSINNIGDAVMALSARVLLAPRYHCSVLLNPKYAELFQDDQVFTEVYCDPQRINDDYDFIILDSVKNRSLTVKNKYFKHKRFAHFRGHFDGIEFNWVLFSFHRINALLNSQYQQVELDKMARPQLYFNEIKAVNSLSVVIAIGGEDRLRRVFHSWGAVISALRTKYPQLAIILVGSANGVVDAAQISLDKQITNLVGKLSLADTAKVINQSPYFIGCDGGLMHIANALGKAGVSLFGYFAPEYRLTATSNLCGLYHGATVDEIPYLDVINAFIKVLNNSRILSNNFPIL